MNIAGIAKPTRVANFELAKIKALQNVAINAIPTKFANIELTSSMS